MSAFGDPSHPTAAVQVVLVRVLGDDGPLSESAKSTDPAATRRTLRAMFSERDRDVLDFESSWWLYPGPKDRAIRDYLGISATRYYQVLRRLIDDPEAGRHAPLTVRRLRRVREEGRQRALARRLGERRGG